MSIIYILFYLLQIAHSLLPIIPISPSVVSVCPKLIIVFAIASVPNSSSPNILSHPMALAKDETHHGQSYYVELLEGGGMYEFDEAEKSSGGIHMSSRSSSLSLSSPSSTNSNNHLYRAMNNNYQHEEGHSVISFKGGFNNNFLSFDQDDLEQLGITNVRLLENFNSIQTASRTMKSNRDGAFGWLNSEETTTSDTIDQELIAEEPCFHKRPHTTVSGESMQTLKKQCTSANRKPKPRSSTQCSKDPQSIAAKNRRERISERLKILQDLVPNGSKVDLVTMLEKAISYVKFLQLQVKVLATDELWPIQGGKAPELSQVKEAIDAILASQRNSNASSK